MKGQYKCNIITLTEFYNSTRKLINHFVDVTIENVFKGENNEGNQLA